MAMRPPDKNDHGGCLQCGRYLCLGDCVTHRPLVGHATPATGPAVIEPAAIDWSKLTVQNVQLSAPKIVDPRPLGIRWLVKPDGTKVLQFATAWSRGFSEHGVDWQDVPEVTA